MNSMTREQLTNEVRVAGLDPEAFRYAVAALIFGEQGGVLLQTRGDASPDEVGKIEGIGGGIGNNDDLERALAEEISSELFDTSTGKPLSGFVIDEFLGWHRFEFTRGGKPGGETWPWIVATFLCRLNHGVNPAAAEPRKITKLRFYTLQELHDLPADALSPWTIKVRDEYRGRYGDRLYTEK